MTVGIIGFADIPYSHASCAAPLFGPPGPCFDSFSVYSGPPLTEKSIMEGLARNIESSYRNWQMTDRIWDDEDEALHLPAIICTEFVADGMKQYRMVKWKDSQTISSFENHRDDSLCDKWLSPIDDGISTKWDKSRYLPEDTGLVSVTDKDMNLNDKKMDSFDIHVWSDTDHKGIELTVTENNNSSGIFEVSVFFITKGESSGVRLLVEDAVYAGHKSNVGSARIINESETRDAATNVYEDSEEMSMASDKVFFSEESIGFGSGTAIFDKSEFHPNTMIIAMLIGAGSFFGLMVFWKKRK